MGERIVTRRFWTLREQIDEPNALVSRHETYIEVPPDGLVTGCRRVRSVRLPGLAWARRTRRRLAALIRSLFVRVYVVDLSCADYWVAAWSRSHAERLVWRLERDNGVTEAELAEDPPVGRRLTRDEETKANIWDEDYQFLITPGAALEECSYKPGVIACSEW